MTEDEQETADQLRHKLNVVLLAGETGHEQASVLETYTAACLQRHRSESWLVRLFIR